MDRTCQRLEARRRRYPGLTRRTVDEVKAEELAPVDGPDDHADDKDEALQQVPELVELLLKRGAVLLIVCRLDLRLDLAYLCMRQ